VKKEGRGSSFPRDFERLWKIRFYGSSVRESTGMLTREGSTNMLFGWKLYWFSFIGV
jgi:hypothetical protein